MHISQKKWSERFQQWKDQVITTCKARPQLTVSAGILSLLTLFTVAGYSFVNANTYDAYFVYVGNERVGAVTKPEVVEKHIIKKYNDLQKIYPNAHMVFNTSKLRYEYKKLFRTPANDKLAIKLVDDRLQTRALGVEIKVNGRSLGIIKDRFAAEHVLELIKNKYVSAQAQKKEQVTIASVSNDMEPIVQSAPRVLEEVRFLENIDFENVEVSPSAVLSEDQILAKLKTGGQEATKYTVREGDTVSTIAAKFNISEELIRQNNKWIVDDTIFPDDILDVTNWRPALSVKTIEVEKETQSINYAVTYVEDASLKKGRQVVVKEGIPGKKIATYRLTKINGVLDQEELINVEVLSQPVTAVVKRGTKIIKGEGTGNFLRPVYGGYMTSSYGYRWGRLHKGIDLVSSNRTIRAADAGRVEYAGYKSDYGYHIIINHGNGYKTLYGHLRSMGVHVGDVVEAGESIGIMGNTGDSTGTHLHFEVIKGGIVRNPAAYLN